MVLVPLNVKYIIFENVVNIKNTALYSPFAQSQKFFIVLHTIFPKGCLRFGGLKNVFLYAWKVPRQKTASANVNKCKSQLWYKILLYGFRELTVID